ncbi:MAG: dihydroorotate dehydrogenase, partial [Dehalococcoidia bacterium]|nr:dihydroorotate dehydrogenase [Dehalococcoidia bacterium]
MELAHEDLAVRLMGLALEHPLMNAAGTCKSLDEVKQLSRASTSAIMVGSITLQERAGNSGNVYVAGPRFSLNSLGMPNPGASYYEKHLPTMAALAHDAGKPLLVSVAGFTPPEYGELAAVAFDGGADAVELNLGCPNVWQAEQLKPIDFDPSTSGVTYPAGATTERQKPIACFDPPLVAE